MMTRQEQLKYCSTCQLKKFNPQKGIICSLTDDIANFEDTCPDYLVDEKIIALERYKKESIGVKKKKKKKARIPEKFTSHDFYLLTAISLITVFFLRLMVYSEFTYEHRNFSVYLYLLVFTSISVALLLRKKELKRYAVFGDLKFKIVFSVLLTILNVVYIIIVYGRFYYVILTGLSFLIITFLLSILSIIVVKPVFFLYRLIVKSHE